MPLSTEPGSDQVDDRVRIKLAGDGDVRIVERYSFHSSILQQPAAFVVHLSGGRIGGPAALTARYPPGPTTRVALYIGPYRQFTGEIDAVNSSGDSINSTIELRGRDLMARLFDQDITAERSFNSATYEEIFKAGLKDVGLGDKVVEISNTANRRIRTGSNTKVFSESPRVSQRLPELGESGKWHDRKSIRQRCASAPCVLCSRVSAIIRRSGPRSRRWRQRSAAYLKPFGNGFGRRSAIPAHAPG